MTDDLVRRLKSAERTCYRFGLMNAQSAVSGALARIAELEAEVARLRDGLALYSCEDGCNDCPEHERDRVGCGWTARAALAQDRGK